MEAGKLWAAVVPVESGDVMSVEQPSAASIRTRLVSDASMVSGADLFTKLEDMRRAIFQAFGLPIPMGPAKRGIVAADPSHDPPGLREVPIWKMGDYENYPKKPEFRDYRMDDDERKRWAKTAFGNPYRDISLEGNARGFMPESNEAVNEALTINYVPDGGEGLNDDAESVRSGSSRASWKTSSSGVPIRKERRRTYTPTKSFDASKLPAVTIEQKAALGLSPKVWARIFAPRSPSPSLSESTNSNAASTSASDNRKRKFAEFVVDIDEDDLYGPEKSDGATSPVDSGEPMPWQDERSAAAQPSAVDAALAEIEAADASKGFVEWRYEITKMFQQMGKSRFPWMVCEIGFI